MDAEDELAGHITGLTILHGSDGHGPNRSEMDSDVEPPAGEAAGDEHEVEDELLGYESAPDLEAEMDEQRRWEASRRERLKRAGLSESDIERRRSQPAFESTPRPIGQGGASSAMPRRNVVFDPEEPRYGSISRANAWPDAAAPLTRGPNAAGVTGPTLPPAMPGLRPRRSMAPSAMGGMHYARPDNERDANTAHDVPELAYTGPSPIARDSFGVQRLLDMIEEMVSEEATSPPPAYLKMSKLPPPKSYDGKDNLDEFELWLRGLLEYFHTLRITGDSMDADRLRLLSSSLTDEAALWFYNTVQSTSREKRNWLFSEAIIGLFRRFIHRDNYLYAAQQFERLKYDASKGGVAALYERLLYISDRMWERPSRYQMRTKFLDALPESFEHVIAVVNGLSVKYNTLTDLYHAALDIEQNTRAMQMRRRAREGHNTVASTTVTRPTKDLSTRRKQTAPPSKPTQPTSVSRPAHYAAKPAEQGRPRTGVPSGDKTRNVPHPNNRPNGKQAATKAAQTCYSCGQIGHFASDPVCPNAGKRDHSGPRMFAQRVLDDTSDHEQAAHDEQVGVADDHVPEPEEDEALVEDETDLQVVGDYPQSEYGWGGSQYESEHEDVFDTNDHYDQLDFAGMRIEPLADEVSDTIHIHSMAVGQDRAARHAWMYDAKVRRIEDPQAQPARTLDTQRTLCAELPINGVKGLVLFDSGCTTDSITPEFAYLCKASRIDLKEPMGLQLGTKGSRTKINFGAQASIALGNICETHYFDVVDIDKYDAILGTVFCRQYGVVLDFAKNRVVMNGKEIPLFVEGGKYASQRAAY